MSSFDELKEALKDTLDKRGSLGTIKARIRAEIFHSLDDESTNQRPQISNTNLVINELIREYLQFNHYNHTLSVLLPESGQPATPALDRGFLSRELNVPTTEATQQIPLLYSIIALMQNTEQPQASLPSTSPSLPSAGGSLPQPVAAAPAVNPVAADVGVGGGPGWVEEEEGSTLVVRR